MKNHLRFFSLLPTRMLATIFVVAFVSGVEAQNKTGKQTTPIAPELYDALKAQGKLDATKTYTFIQPIAEGTMKNTNNTKALRSGSDRNLTSPPCAYVPTIGFDDPFGGNVYFDDSPPGGAFQVQIPFDFCFYGTTYNSFFINNNGNITFEQAYATFTAQSFPAAAVPPMIAPFWGDVDTGSPTNPLGQVRYKIYPEYAIVSWDTVSVYNEIASLRNTFQLLISNGTSPVLPPNTNIAFLYKDMQWTTGDASGGNNGFGGTPATVGVNRGDGVDYIQLGLFDAPGTNYDGPFGANDQVSFLDNNVFFFNTCLEPGTQNNIAPLAIGAPLCDTITVCAGETYPLDFNFIPVEPGQTADAELITPDVPGLALIGITPGTQCNVQAVFTGSSTNVGYHNIQFTATDNGTPSASYTINLVFQVVENGFVPVITGVPNICDGNSTTLSVGGGSFDQYVWAPNNEETPTINVTTPGEYSVTVAIGSCIGTSEPFLVGVAPLPTPVIAGNDTICGDQLAQLFTSEQYNGYQWSSLSLNDTVSVGAGSYTVTVTDTNGCQGTSAPFIVTEVNALTPVITGDNHTCFDGVTTLTTTQTYEEYTWSNNTGVSVPFINVSAGTYTVSVVDENGCAGTSAPFTVTNSAPSPDILGVERFCEFDTIPLFVTDTFATYRWIYEGDTLSSIDSLFWSGGTETSFEVQLIVTDAFGCAGIDSVDAPYTPQPEALFTTNPELTAILKNTLITFNDASIPGTGDTLAFWEWVFVPPSADDTLVGNSQTQVYPDTGFKEITLIVTTELGCKDTLTRSVQIIDKPFVPNVFSPNGDGKNDFFKIPFLYGYPGNSVAVFNRWGTKVFEGENYNNDWDGDDLPSGTYFYVVTAPTLDEPLKGSVTLIRE